MDAVATIRNGLGRQNPGLVQLLGLMVAAHNWHVARRARRRGESDAIPAGQVGS